MERERSLDIEEILFYAYPGEISGSVRVFFLKPCGVQQSPCDNAENKIKAFDQKRIFDTVRQQGKHAVAVLNKGRCEQY